VSRRIATPRALNPPKNGVIALWPNTRVVKCKYYVSQKQNGFNDKIHWYSILLTLVFKSRRSFDGLKYMYSVISVIVDSLPGNTKKRESTRSWTARVRLVISWADIYMYINEEIRLKYKFPLNKWDEYKISHCFGCLLSIPVACLCMCVLFYFYFVCLHVCAYAFKSRVHCGSAFEPGASRLPYYYISICVYSWCNGRASCVDSKPKKKKKVLKGFR